MICEKCRKAPATIHISDLGGDQGIQSWDLCAPCTPPLPRQQGQPWLTERAKLPLPRVWACVSCSGIAENRRDRQVVQPVLGDGLWGYIHAGCTVPVGYQLAPGFVRVERVKLTAKPCPADPCDCELRNRKWNPNTGRCGFCGREYYDPR